MALLVFWRMFWFVSWFRVNFGRKLLKGFGKQLQWNGSLDAGEPSCSLLKGSLAPCIFAFTSGASGLFPLLFLCCTAGSDH